MAEQLRLGKVLGRVLGEILGVERGGFIPTDLAGLVAWWDASFGVTISTGVSELLDRSGNGNTLTQSTGSEQPAFSGNGFNGFPTLQFDGTDDFMEAADSDSLSLDGDFTAFVVTRIDGAVITERHFFSKDKSDGYSLRATPLTEIQVEANDGGGAETITSVDSPNVNVDEILSAQFIVGAPTNFRQDGNSLGLPPLNTLTGITPGSGKLSLGAFDASNPSFFFQGEITNVLIYNRALTISEQNQVGQYLADRYELTWNTIFEPTDLNDSLILFLDPAVGITFEGMSTFIDSWRDRSKFQYDFLGVGNPDLDDDGMNGLPTVVYDTAFFTEFGGAPEHLDITDSFSVYFVLNVTDIATLQQLMNIGESYDISLVASTQAVQTDVRDNVGAQVDTSASNMTTGTNVILEVHYDVGGSINFTQNGIALGASQANTLNSIKTNPIEDFFLFSGEIGAFPFNGNGSDVVFFNKLLSTTERNQVGNYLSEKYGIAWTDVT